MNFVPTSIVTLAGIAMLSMQMSGLHLHASTPTDDVRVHGTHVHDLVLDGHDHGSNVDVSLIEFGVVWSKLVPALPALLPTVLAIVWILLALWPPPVPVLSQRRRFRWRPPLRAPPLSP